MHTGFPSRQTKQFAGQARRADEQAWPAGVAMQRDGGRAVGVVGQRLLGRRLRGEQWRQRAIQPDPGGAGSTERGAGAALKFSAQTIAERADGMAT